MAQEDELTMVKADDPDTDYSKIFESPEWKDITDGRDGSVDLDGKCEYDFARRDENAQGVTYYITRDVRATHLWVADGVTIIHGNFRIGVRDGFQMGGDKWEDEERILCARSSISFIYGVKLAET